MTTGTIRNHIMLTRAAVNLGYMPRQAYQPLTRNACSLCQARVPSLGQAQEPKQAALTLPPKRSLSIQFKPNKNDDDDKKNGEAENAQAWQSYIPKNFDQLQKGFEKLPNSFDKNALPDPRSFWGRLYDNARSRQRSVIFRSFLNRVGGRFASTAKYRFRNFFGLQQPEEQSYF